MVRIAFLREANEFICNRLCLCGCERNFMCLSKTEAKENQDQIQTGSETSKV